MKDCQVEAGATTVIHDGEVGKIEKWNRACAMQKSRPGDQMVVIGERQG